MNRSYCVVRVFIVALMLLTLHTLTVPVSRASAQAVMKPVVSEAELLLSLQEEGVYMTVEKKKNRLTVFHNGRVVRTFPVATGRRVELTPTGTFRIVTKIVKPWYVRKKIRGGDPANPLGSRWLGLSVPGTGGYTYGIHGTNRPYSIGTSASSGCIRMLNRDVEWLYRHIPLGTVVFIKE
ncbi:L,D-transpeptidase [Paenibacillus sp. YYML68]|uniref:L,D-transpeptidase n=1 Tax=Paenibacillus sp. YYML68 TaxID=2909250 RepID=UPI00249118EA|nr:L,D-transpeptidase [Paenibacillus sp. YYML68]